MAQIVEFKYATIREVKGAKGRVTFEVQLRVPGRKQSTRTFKTREAAEDFIRTTLPKIVVSAPTVPSAGAWDGVTRHADDPTCKEELLKEKLSFTIERFKLSDRVRSRHLKTIPTILEHIEDVRLGGLNKLWAQQYIEKMQGERTRAKRFFSPATIAVHFQIMRLIVNWRADTQELARISHSLSTDLLPPGWDEHRERLLEDGEEERIRKVIEARPGEAGFQWGHLFTLAFETAARLQELILAQWKEFDLARRVWTIPKSHTKTKQSRAIPLSRAATAAILALKERAAGGRLSRVFHAMSKPNVVSALFHRHTLEAGVEDFRFHDLRHCAVTNMVLNKPKLRDLTIMKISGHTTVKSFLRYANLRMGDVVADMD